MASISAVDEATIDHGDLFKALTDETASAILQYTTSDARSAKELADLTNVSLATVYRRLDALEETNLVREDLRLDTGGNHYRVYRSAVKRVEVRIDDDTIETRVEWREDTADRFTRIWDQLRGD